MHPLTASTKCGEHLLLTKKVQTIRYNTEDFVSSLDLSKDQQCVHKTLNTAGLDSTVQ